MEEPPGAYRPLHVFASFVNAATAAARLGSYTSSASSATTCACSTSVAATYLSSAFGRPAPLGVALPRLPLGGIISGALRGGLSGVAGGFRTLFARRPPQPATATADSDRASIAAAADEDDAADEAAPAGADEADDAQ